jgi:sugar O-acyltransferase (sialic acid O-acetyltransferase NeuD family)
VNPLYIVGAGAFGREVLAWAMDVPANARDWELAGFLDDRSGILANAGTPVGVVGSPSAWEVKDSHRFVVAIGEPATKLEYARALEARGAKFASVVHPTAIIGPRTRVGEGAIICPYVVLTTDVSLGRFVTINVHSSIGHDVQVGEGCTLSAHCDVTGGARLGEGVLLGSHAVVLPGAVVGKFAIVGAGSVALRRVREHTTVMGVPAVEVVRPARKA